MIMKVFHLTLYKYITPTKFKRTAFCILYFHRMKRNKLRCSSHFPSSITGSITGSLRVISRIIIDFFFFWSENIPSAKLSSLKIKGAVQK